MGYGATGGGVFSARRLKLLNLEFDFIFRTESKIRRNETVKTDISIKGYSHPVGMPRDAAKGGVLTYTKEGNNCKPREDLNIHSSKELESYFLELCCIVSAVRCT